MAQITFKMGFVYKGQWYGWKDKILYRLPVLNKITGRTYAMKKLATIEHEGQTCYRIMQDKKSIVQLKELSHSISIKVGSQKHKDLP